MWQSIATKRFDSAVIMHSVLDIVCYTFTQSTG
jgi:hypothetical protein